MNELVVREIDPRDAKWEVDEPAYRVTFRTPLGPPGAWAARSLEICGGDAPAVLEWTSRHTEIGQRATVSAVARCDQELGLIRLSGRDPTRNH